MINFGTDWCRLALFIRSDKMFYFTKPYCNIIIRDYELLDFLLEFFLDERERNESVCSRYVDAEFMIDSR